MMRYGRSVTVEVTADGAGLVSHPGSALVAQVADKPGLARALSTHLGVIKQRRRGHDPGRVIPDLAVMLADGGACVADLAAVREQHTLFGGWRLTRPRLGRSRRSRRRRACSARCGRRTPARASGSGSCTAHRSG